MLVFTLPSHFLIVLVLDIISFLKSFGSLEEYQTQSGPQSRLTLTIADEEDRTINCLLWGDVVANAYWSKQDDIEPPIIIAIQFARIDIKDGNIQISNTYNATKVSYNPDIPQAKQLLDRLHRTPISHPRSFTQIIAQDTRLSSVRSIIDLAKRIHISEIIPSQQEIEFGTKGTIYKLQTANGWTYDGCNSCKTKPRVQNGQLYYGGCKTYITEMGPK
ncbi:uncharacterized protein LOC129321874 isoform X1 [Prosopis cineraria]|uniref:uncharacterized protein LOC129321874 isoform X1 n=1 Tax=Prosopis cineraria TaxID=364024 RepID=UPI00240FD780|nr:uncharacterized protein LOC129321874 isoform X1 [Prosopis cineraria]